MIYFLILWSYYVEDLFSFLQIIDYCQYAKVCTVWHSFTLYFVHELLIAWVLLMYPYLWK